MKPKKHAKQGVRPLARGMYSRVMEAIKITIEF